MKTQSHSLKINPASFAAHQRNEKPFEIRLNDRNYQIGDELILKEWTEEGGFTGLAVNRIILSISEFMQRPGYAVLGLKHSTGAFVHGIGCETCKVVGQNDGSQVVKRGVSWKHDSCRVEELSVRLDSAEGALSMMGRELSATKDALATADHENAAKADKVTEYLVTIRSLEVSRQSLMTDLTGERVLIERMRRSADTMRAIEELAINRNDYTVEVDQTALTAAFCELTRVVLGGHKRPLIRQQAIKVASIAVVIARKSRGVEQRGEANGEPETSTHS